jgi:hypothetical protein
VLSDAHWQAPPWCFGPTACTDAAPCGPSILDEPLASGRLLRPRGAAVSPATAAAAAAARAAAARRGERAAAVAAAARQVAAAVAAAGGRRR